MTDFLTIKLVTDDRGVATVTLNRPDKHNAINSEMIAELTRVADKLSADDTIRVVVLAAAGKSFCAGGDLGWMQSQMKTDRAGRIAESRKLATMLSALNKLPKPLIARVQGAAYGGGIGLMAISDVAIAVDGTRFGLTETKLGLIPATIGPFVVRRMGEGFARQVYFTGKSFGTEIALRSSLVTKTCGAQSLDRHVDEEVSTILTCAPGAVSEAKALCRTLGGSDLDKHIDQTVALLADRWESEEAQHGINAFFAHEKPNWVA